MWSYWRVPLPCCMGFETRPSERDGARTCLLPVISVISLLFGESQAPGQGGRDAFTHPGSPRLAVPAAGQSRHRAALGSRHEAALPAASGAPRPGMLDREVPVAGREASGPENGRARCWDGDSFYSSKALGLPTGRALNSRLCPRFASIASCHSSFFPENGKGRRALACPCSAGIKPLTSLQGLRLCLWNSNHLFIKLSRPPREALRLPGRNTDGDVGTWAAVARSVLQTAPRHASSEHMLDFNCCFSHSCTSHTWDGLNTNPD